MPRANAPIIRVGCRTVEDARLENETHPGVVIDADDVEMLRVIAGRGDLIVAFMSRRRTIHEGPVKAILQRLEYVPSRDLWYLPTVTPSPVAPARLIRWRDSLNFIARLSSAHR